MTEHDPTANAALRVTPEQREGLLELGWNDTLEADFLRLASPDTRPARVASVERGGFFVVENAAAIDAPTLARLEGTELDSTAQPAVGDWVALVVREGTPGITAVLPRRSALLRRASGRQGRAQVVVCNLDYLFIVTAIGFDLNLGRLERYLIGSLAADIAPVIVINKIDREHDRAEIDALLKELGIDVPVLFTCALEPGGIDTLEPYLRPGSSVALVGSSGVGKSTLANRILQTDRLATGDVRHTDDRGRHTTTRRELWRAPGGALIIDTPGMREFGLWDARDGVAKLFPEIHAAAESCHFRDCTHVDEPGCGLLAALDDEAIDEDRYARYLRALEELAETEALAAESTERLNARRERGKQNKLRTRKGSRRKHWDR